MSSLEKDQVNLTGNVSVRFCKNVYSDSCQWIQTKKISSI